MGGTSRTGGTGGAGTFPQVGEHGRGEWQEGGGGAGGATTGGGDETTNSTARGSGTEIGAANVRIVESGGGMKQGDGTRGRMA